MPEQGWQGVRELRRHVHFECLRSRNDMAFVSIADRARRGSFQDGRLICVGTIRRYTSLSHKRHRRAPQSSEKCGVSERINPEGGKYVTECVHRLALSVHSRCSLKKKRATKLAQPKPPAGTELRQMFHSHQPDGFQERISFARNELPFPSAHIDGGQRLWNEFDVVGLGKT